MQRRTRRALLSSLAGGLPALAGCTGPTSRGSGGTVTTSETQTVTGSPSSDGEPAPRVVDLDEEATRWAVRFDDPVTTRPTIADGSVVVGTSDHGFGTPEPGSDETWTLAALASDDGSPQWTTVLPAQTVDDPVVADDGVYVQTGFSTGHTGVEQRLVKVAEGERRWQSEPVSGFNTLLGVAASGRAFVGTSDDAIGASGQPLLAIDGDDGSPTGRSSRATRSAAGSSRQACSSTSGASPSSSATRPPAARRGRSTAG